MTKAELGEWWVNADYDCCIPGQEQSIFPQHLHADEEFILEDHCREGGECHQGTVLHVSVYNSKIKMNNFACGKETACSEYF